MVLGAIALGAGGISDSTGWLTAPAVAAIVLALGFRVFRVKYELQDVERKAVAAAESQGQLVVGDIQKVSVQVSELVNTVVSDMYHEAEQCTRDGFYDHMLNAVERAQVSVDLTQLDERPPKDIGTARMVAYFKRQAEIVAERPHVIFRRIVSVPTLEKLAWVLDVLEKVGTSPNFQIAVVDTSSAGPTLPPPLSLQIFDDREICLVDPTIGYMLPERQKNMLWVNGGATAAIFSLYYEEFWKLTTRLKEGSTIYWTVLDDLLETLAARRPDQHALAEELRARIARMSGRDTE